MGSRALEGGLPLLEEGAHSLSLIIGAEKHRECVALQLVARAKMLIGSIFDRALGLGHGKWSPAGDLERDCPAMVHQSIRVEDVQHHPNRLRLGSVDRLSGKD